MPKQIEIKKLKYEEDKLNSIVDTKITELIPDTRFFIKNIHDFFKYYEKVKNDISKFEDEESHQNLFYNAIKLTEGEIIVWPINAGEDSETIYTWNDIELMANKINNLQTKLTELQLENVNLNSNINTLEESIESITEQISNNS